MEYFCILQIERCTHELIFFFLFPLLTFSFIYLYHSHPTELGGKSPVIVFESADLDSAVEGVVDAIWFNQGQVSWLSK